MYNKCDYNINGYCKYLNTNVGKKCNCPEWTNSNMLIWFDYKFFCHKNGLAEGNFKSLDKFMLLYSSKEGI